MGIWVRFQNQFLHQNPFHLIVGDEFEFLLALAVLFLGELEENHTYEEIHQKERTYEYES